MYLTKLGMVCLLLWGFTSNLLYAQSQNSVAGDRQALEDLYHATNGNNWKKNSGWLKGNPSDSWYGVDVDANGRVIRVDLKDNNLEGSNGLPASIGNLKKMRYFNVMHNYIDGELPEELFSQCTSLVYLYLNFVTDSNENPVTLDPHLRAQTGGSDVHTGKRDQGAKNKFTGGVPASTNLPNLEWFTLSWTNISYVDHAIFNSSKMKGFFVANNPQLAGNKQTIPPAIGNMTGLQHFAVTQARFPNQDKAWGGVLPSEMGNLTELISIRLGRNAFTGHFPDMSACTKIETFTLGFNNFTSGFPEYAIDGTWPNINSFGAGFNDNWSDASLPIDIDNDAKTVNLNNANLSGPLLKEQFPRQLVVMDFSYNNLSGETPANLRHLTRIRNLRWEHNNLSGQWPDLDWTNKQGLKWSDGRPAHPLRNFTRAKFKGNRYVFADMLVVSDNGKTLFEWYQQEADVSFNYAPQKEFGSGESINGFTLDFSNVVTHPDNNYRWYRNGNRISGESNSVIDASKYGLGTYKLEVTNPNVPGLTLESIEIKVTESGGVAIGGGDGNDGSKDGYTDDPGSSSNAPSLNWPENGVSSTSITPAFEWEPVEGADYYILHSNSINPTAMVIEAQVGEPSFIPENSLSPLTTHHWRVRAVKDGVEGEWSPVWEFTTGDIISNVNNPPASPSPASPKDGTAGTSTTLNLDWEPLSRAETYHLQVASNKNFASPELDQSGITLSSWEVSDLNNFTTFYWRVKASNEAGSSDWSEIRSFTTAKANQIPAAPKLVSPNDGSSDVAGNPSMEWNTVTGADSYSLQIATSEDFINVARNLDNLTSTTERVSGLAKDTTYYWRVRAVEDGVKGDWSSIWTFTTGTKNDGGGNDDHGDEDNTDISAPSLSLPAADAKNVPLTPKFQWNKMDADHYILQVNSESSGSVIYTQVQGTTSRFKSTKELNPETVYSWRVRAVKNGEKGEWSAERTFTTGSGPAEMGTSLGQNYPNPFNPSTQIRFSLGETQEVSLKVYNSAGRLVATLVEKTLTAGTYERTFRADNLASGVYFIRLITDNRVLNSRMTLLK